MSVPGLAVDVDETVENLDLSLVVACSFAEFEFTEFVPFVFVLVPLRDRFKEGAREGEGCVDSLEI